MGSRYVDVSRETLENALQSWGFTRALVRGEVVYQRQHHLDPTMFVKIYTSLPGAGGDVRGCGEDAIRVLLVFENKVTGLSGCLYKTARVFRTGSEEAVIARVHERLREAYAAGILRHQRCPAAGIEELAKAMARDAARDAKGEG